MTVVLDASAWVDVLTVGLVIDELVDARVCVPPHFDVEVLGFVRALQQHGHLDPSEANDTMDRHRRRELDRVFSTRDMTRAWDLREAMSFKDAWYVALAERLNVPWVTADGRAARAARRLGVAVQIV